ncbi:uncharacterized protein At3g43530-like [Eutrema salsugineum]|uniref:uncharacterized protein At3g43530-like n=1 Tax=Eutrema salsugineum TaxID=72664 RepID=UPI000CED1B87|nr:uncharacterized protein At3g43530-like [Eutrema salsugineum]
MDNWDNWNNFDADDDGQPMLPEKLYFGPTEYSKGCRILTRCSVESVVDKIDNLAEEKAWFRANPQFKQNFHMFKEPNHMNQGMWMLLLPTAHTERLSKCWFIFNGVPIRYSLGEHTLLSGLDCRDYPADYKNLGNTKFFEKHFGREAKLDCGCGS